MIAGAPPVTTPSKFRIQMKSFGPKCDHLLLQLTSINSHIWVIRITNIVDIEFQEIALARKRQNPTFGNPIYREDWSKKGVTLQAFELHSRKKIGIPDHSMGLNSSNQNPKENDEVH